MLTGKNAVITGAGSGIGFATVEAFARNGCNIWACAHNKNASFEERLGNLAEKYKVNVQPVYFDVTDAESVKIAVKAIMQTRTPIDILVNNAGVAQYDMFSFMSMNTLKEIFEVNYVAPLQLAQLLARRMNRESASIIFVSSVAGLTPVEGNTAYGGSKAAIAHATGILNKELASLNIRVNAVAPGMVDTPMKEKANEVIWNELVSRTSLKRAARPEEIANVICFLASDMASYITGQVIRVDGGMC